MNTRNAIRYSSTTAHAVQGSMPTVSPWHPSVAALLESLNTSGVVATAISLPSPGRDRPLRATLGLGMVGAEGTQITEDLYSVSLSGLADGLPGVCAEKLASIAWTAGASSIPTSIGGVASHVSPKAVVVDATGLLLRRTRVEIEPTPTSPAWVEIYDLGEMDALVRVIKRPASNAATSALPMDRLWR